jgi:hypothetical protein
MGKSAANLFDAVDDDESGGYSVVDRLVWLGFQAVSLTSSLSLFLKKNAPDRILSDSTGGGSALVTKLIHLVQDLIQGGDVLQVVAVIAFVLSTGVVLTLQLDHRYVGRLAGAGLVSGILYTLATGGSLDGWAHDAPLFVWGSLFLSNIVPGESRLAPKRAQVVQPPRGGDSKR